MTTKAVIAAIGTKLFLAKIIIAYAVTYSVFSGHCRNKTQYKAKKVSSRIGVFQRIVYCIAVSVVTLCYMEIEYRDQH
jgi:hypothetical protein